MTKFKAMNCLLINLELNKKIIHQLG